MSIYLGAYFGQNILLNKIAFGFTTKATAFSLETIVDLNGHLFRHLISLALLATPGPVKGNHLKSINGEWVVERHPRKEDFLFFAVS